MSLAYTRANRTKNFLVRRLTKSGNVSRRRFTAIEWQLDAHTTRDAAERRRLELERLNPGSRYVLTDRAGNRSDK